MNLKNRILLVFLLLGALPLAAVCTVNYFGATGAVEAGLRGRAGERAERAAGALALGLKRQEDALLGLARSEPLRAYVDEVRRAGGGANANKVPADVSAGLESFLTNSSGLLESVALLAAPGSTLGRARWEGGGVVFQTADMILSGGVRYDERVWALSKPEALCSQVAPEAQGAFARVTAPVFVGGEATPAGALLLEVRVRALLAQAAGGEAPRERGEGASHASACRSLFAVENSSGQLVYHSNGALDHRSLLEAMPHFAGAAGEMRAGRAGTAFYEDSGGDICLAAYAQAPELGLSLAASENYTESAAPVRRAGLWSTGLVLAAGAAGFLLLLRTTTRAEADFRQIARGAGLVAAGEFERPIEVETAGEMRALANTLNAMRTRLREMIAREAESRQFESFLRISAMISHDLKNAIAGLSMLVSNMERQFHREEFRADAIESLREAAEKLKRTVARLSEPVKSLSGEYRREARPTDLVPLVRRVLAARAEPYRPLYDIESRLPESLVATVEPERVEAVVENLVVNALEAMGAKGGRLTVEAGAEGDYVHLVVADTGTGMTEEFMRTRLFHPFATTKTRGIGLGLFTCKEVVEAHGGRLEVESRPGAGTRFRVVLPSRLFKSGDRQRRPPKGTD